MFIRLLRGHGYEKRKRYELHDPSTHCKPLDCRMDTHFWLRHTSHTLFFRSLRHINYTGRPINTKIPFLSMLTVSWDISLILTAFILLWISFRVRCARGFSTGRVLASDSKGIWGQCLAGRSQWVGYYSVEGDSALCQFALAISRHGYVWCGVLLHFPPSSRSFSQSTWLLATGIDGRCFPSYRLVWFPCLFAQHNVFHYISGGSLVYLLAFAFMLSTSVLNFFLINSTRLMIGGLFIYKPKGGCLISRYSCSVCYPPFSLIPNVCGLLLFSYHFSTYFDILRTWEAVWSIFFVFLSLFLFSCIYCIQVCLLLHSFDYDTAVLIGWSVVWFYLASEFSPASFDSIDYIS